jgi:hypothetical protein
MVGESILDYAKDARRKKKKDIENAVKGKWCRFRRDWRVDGVKPFHEQSLQYGSAKLLKDELDRISQDLKQKLTDSSRNDYQGSVD